MGLFDDVLGILGPLALPIAILLVAVGLYAVVKGLSAGTTLPVVGFAVLLGLVAVFLFLEGELAPGILALGGAVLVGILDGLHERRINRRAWARMKG